MLEQWISGGIDASHLNEIAKAESSLFHNLDKKLQDKDPQCSPPQRFRLLPFGLDLCDWQLHAWLNKLDLQVDTIIEEKATDEPEARSWPLVIFQFEAIALFTAGHDQIYQLSELAHAHSVYDTNDEHVKLLRRLGINAKSFPSILKSQRSHAWLDRTGSDTAVASLGLPEAELLKTVGDTLCLGCGNDRGWTDLIRPPLMALPAFDRLTTKTWGEARELAAWLLAVINAGIRVVRINPTDHEIRKQGFRCLEEAAGKKVHAFIDPIRPDELIAELAWREEGCKAPELPVTPKPEVKILWDASHDHLTPDATVCVSLYNYKNTILNALESIKSQRNVMLDVIVVDDGSLDGGEQLVLTWMEGAWKNFSRTQLIKHKENGGLSSARNSAFAMARTEWCFILDADNVLHPDALSQCLKLTKTNQEKLAVIHPMIDIAQGVDLEPVDELVSEHSWQPHRFVRANHVDAMALVRRSAWEEVGGFQHIPNGWEDYDFWCSLISRGYYGVICPQVLATYCVHEKSMLRTNTQGSIRQISRLLQKRHSWLDLTTGNGMLEGGLQ